MRLPAIAVLTLSLMPAAFAGWGVSVNIGAPPYYGYAPREVVYAQRYIPAPEMRRVFVVARYGRVSPNVVVDYYRRGYGWDGICAQFGVPMDMMYERDYMMAPPPVRVYRPAPVYGYYEAPRPVYRERYYEPPRREWRGHEYRDHGERRGDHGRGRGRW